MSKFLIFTLSFLVISNIHAQKIISIEAEGNLESSNPCGCVDLSEVTSEHNPADILNGMRKCIELKQFKKAARLFALAGVYGKYDAYRVKDRTAHQALLVLQQNILADTDERDKKKLAKCIEKELEKGSEQLSSVCQLIQQIGMPTYHPKYMIQHGIQAFMKPEGDGLVEEFDSEASWNLALENYLHCGEK